MNNYERIVKLLIQIIPHIAKEKVFALKGGTAINLFYLNMPRLSVDIDLAYLPAEEREKSLQDIRDTLNRVTDSIRSTLRDIKIIPSKIGKNPIPVLNVFSSNAKVSIEVNSRFRGHVFPVEERDLCKAAQNVFHMFTSIQCLSLDELYGGKISAALERNEPRDFFDIKLLLDNKGLTQDVLKSFVVYLAIKDEMHDLLNGEIHKKRGSQFN